MEGGHTTIPGHHLKVEEEGDIRAQANHRTASSGSKRWVDEKEHPDEELGQGPYADVYSKDVQGAMAIQHPHGLPLDNLYTRSRKDRKLWVVVLTALVSIAFYLVTPSLVHRRLPWKSSSSCNDADVGTSDSGPFAKEPFERTEDVQFDRYSLFLKGQRIFLHSGEVHTFRLPVPSLWPDIMEKTKAAGLNSISLYTHMGLINPAPGVVDFNGFRALQPFFDAAKEAGIWIVLRPGPYINAETSAGGIAHWTTSEVAGSLRTNATDWKEAWQDYVRGIIDVTLPNQINRGGPIIAVQIDNEYRQDNPAQAEYFVDLEEAYRDAGVVVPLTYNDPGPRRNFINGTGAVDLYGMDSYPQGFDCSNPTIWKPVTTDYHQYHEEVNPSQPWYIPEFQAGAFDAWGPTAPGYGPCRILTGPDFQSVFNLQLWASNAKLINHYMLYGGTSWGAIPFHGVYTSYDYGAPITESRELTTKYDELKRQSMFLRSSPDFYKTDWISDSSTGLRASNNPEAFVTYLKNPDTDAGFYVVRQTNSTSTGNIRFEMDIKIQTGKVHIPILIPYITLGGRQSKMVVADYAFGKSSKLVYSTAQVFFAGVIGGRDVLFLHGETAHEHEASLRFRGTPNRLRGFAPGGVKFVTASPPYQHMLGGASIFGLTAGIKGLVTIWDSDSQLVMYADSETAATFWSPIVPGSDASDPFRQFWGIGTNQSVLVGGPYLVRSADMEGHTLALRGDLKESVRLTIIAPGTVRNIKWNGELITPDVQGVGQLSAFDGVFVASLSTSKALNALDLKIPKLKGWKFSDSLPEIGREYDDSHWILADRKETNIRSKMYYGDGRVLYGCDYGFCENVVMWRGHFEATGNEKSVNLSINGGEAFAASVWLNDVFLGASFGNSTNNRNIIEETDDQFVFPAGSLLAGRDNVITVVQDNMGLNETDGRNTDSSRGPRGIRGFQLNNGAFGEWRVQGKVGGYRNYLDKTRGIFNEGGLFGERKGWHLPGFDTSSWLSRDLSLGLPSTPNHSGEWPAGVGFFITKFKLNIPSGLDVMLSFTFEEEIEQPYRAFLFVNGWMMGKRVGNLGPQSKFPVHQGILDYQGDNTVAVALWAMTPGVPVTPKLELRLDGIYDSAIGKIVVDNPGWSCVGRELN